MEGGEQNEEQGGQPDKGIRVKQWTMEGKGGGRFASVAPSCRRLTLSPAMTISGENTRWCLFFSFLFLSFLMTSLFSPFFVCNLSAGVTILREYWRFKAHIRTRTLHPRRLDTTVT